MEDGKWSRDASVQVYEKDSTSSGVTKIKRVERAGFLLGKERRSSTTAGPAQVLRMRFVRQLGYGKALELVRSWRTRCGYLLPYPEVCGHAVRR
jgi:hypothetical protein